MYNIKELSEMCEHLNKQEEKANKAQRESIKYKQCEFLKDKIGETFIGIISSIQSYGVFIELVDNGCDVMISEEWLNSNNLFIDVDKFCVNNLSNGESYSLGNEIAIKIEKVNMAKKQINGILII